MAAVGIHSYFKRYKQRMLLVVILVQLISTALAAIFAWLLWHNPGVDTAILFPACIGALLVINLFMAPLILNTATRPFGLLAQAIAHVSKDPVVTPPPILTTKDEASGLKALIQTVYEIAVASNSQQPEKQVASAMAADFFKQVADRTPCGIIVLNYQGNVIYANGAAPSGTMPDGSLSIDLIFEQNNNLKTWLADSRANKVRDTHIWLRVADKLPGEENRRIFDIIGYYQKNDAAGIEVVLVTFDRTAIYSNDQEDMDFIALAAHELRGPITVIRGYLDVLNQEIGETVATDQKELLERLQVSAERLAGYVNNILNVSRYDRHQFKMHLQEEHLAPLVKALMPDLTLRAKTQNRFLTFKIPDTLPTIAADNSSLGEVITNLVDNAIKYSHDGGEIVITAAPKDNLVEVTVQDHGIGIPASVVGNLFNRFYRSHRSKQQVGGTGLGLYICKTIVEAHGGTLWVRSVEGQGSVFGFTIPTYASVANSLQSGNNKGIVQRAEGWIKNHAMYRG